MYDAMENEIDAVVISTPDHMHFHPAYQAIEMGKHVYLEKPMAHNLWEARTLTDRARNKGVATQLGVQRHTIPNMHRVVELIQSGAIGRVNEVYSWVSSSRGMPGVPKEKPAVPAHLDWDLWLGPAVARDYHPSICPYGWRFWWDYGTGEMGNWGCHILDIPFWALGLKYPTKVEAGGDPVDSLRSPKSMRSTFEFPAADGGKPIVLHWDQAKNGPEILQKYDLPLKGNNNLFIGEEGMLLCGFSKLALYPEAKFESFLPPAKSIPDSPGFYTEFVTACKGGKAATCNFEYSGPLAETVLLANLAYRTSSKFDWDAANLKPSDEAALNMIREPYRKGWEV
jgi:predicted dehydrogenase